MVSFWHLKSLFAIFRRHGPNPGDLPDSDGSEDSAQVIIGAGWTVPGRSAWFRYGFGLDRSVAVQKKGFRIVTPDRIVITGLIIGSDFEIMIFVGI